LSDRIKGLIDRGIRQYARPHPPFDVYMQRVIQGHNWMMSEGEELLGIVSLIPNGIGVEWAGAIEGTQHYWLNSLFVNQEHKHKRIGSAILEQCENYAIEQDVKALLLDCYTGHPFLEQYYGRSGFTVICRKGFSYPGHSFDAALMRKMLE
jgi:GNAT superfamily N-acetyltransferase